MEASFPGVVEARCPPPTGSPIPSFFSGFPLRLRRNPLSWASKPVDLRPLSSSEIHFFPPSLHDSPPFFPSRVRLSLLRARARVDNLPEVPFSPKHNTPPPPPKRKTILPLGSRFPPLHIVADRAHGPTPFFFMESPPPPRPEISLGRDIGHVLEGAGRTPSVF